MGALNIFSRNIKWRFQNPVTIFMTLIQPLIWLVIFSTLFANSSQGGANYTAFVLPGILIMDVLSGAGISGIATYSNKAGGSFYRMVISPVKRGAIVLGHILDVAALAFMQVAALGAIAFLMSVRMATGLLGLLLSTILLFCVVFFVASISYALSMVIPDENAFIAMANTFILPLFFLSTALIAKAQAPIVFRIIISINPFTYAIDSLRNLINDSYVNWTEYGIAIGLFGVLGIIAFCIAKNAIKREA